MNETHTTNLHSLWDSGLITLRLQQDFQRNVSLYYDYIYRLMQNLSSVDNDDNIEQWIKENMNLICSQIYVDDNNVTMNSSVEFHLGETYYQTNIVIVEQRLAYSGRRLGAILNRLATKRPRKPLDNKDRLCSGTIALIVVLCAEGVLAVVLGIILWFRHKKKSLSVSSPAILVKT